MALYEQFARVGKALANPARLELLDLLAQGERSVEDLARAAQMKVSNTSAQLRMLAGAGLVASRPDGVSVPHDQLAARLAEIPAGADIVAYCRGRYCVFAPEAVRLLRASGFSARPLGGGLPDWSLAGLPVTVGASA